MEELVEELKKILPFKESTDIGDVVLIAGENPQMLVYAYVTDIERDSSRRDEWWHVHLSLFTVPLQNVVWTLRTPQMTGREIFTMGGDKRFVKAIELVTGRTTPQPSKKKISRPKNGEKGKVLQFKRPNS